MLCKHAVEPLPAHSLGRIEQGGNLSLSSFNELELIAIGRGRDADLLSRADFTVTEHQSKLGAHSCIQCDGFLVINDPRQLISLILSVVNPFKGCCGRCPKRVWYVGGTDHRPTITNRLGGREERSVASWRQTVAVNNREASLAITQLWNHCSDKQPQTRPRNGHAAVMHLCIAPTLAPSPSAPPHLAC